QHEHVGEVGEVDVVGDRAGEGHLLAGLADVAADHPPGGRQLPLQILSGPPPAPVGLGGQEAPDRLDIDPARVVVELVRHGSILAPHEPARYRTQHRFPAMLGRMSAFQTTEAIPFAPGEAIQGSLFDQGSIGLTPLLGTVTREDLGRGAWIDVLPGWLSGADLLFRALAADVPWYAERRQMYERVVDVPRLLCFYGEHDPLPHPVLTEARDALSAHYAEE